MNRGAGVVGVKERRGEVVLSHETNSERKSDEAARALGRGFEQHNNTQHFASQKNKQTQTTHQIPPSRIIRVGRGGSRGSNLGCGVRKASNSGLVTLALSSAPKQRPARRRRRGSRLCLALSSRPALRPVRGPPPAMLPATRPLASVPALPPPPRVRRVPRNRDAGRSLRLFKQFGIAEQAGGGRRSTGDACNTTQWLL